jgi:hypothetical protein
MKQWLPLLQKPRLFEVMVGDRHFNFSYSYN